MWLNCKKSIEGRWRCGRPDEGKEDRAQNHPQPSEDEAEIVADGAQDGIGRVAFAALQVATAEMAICFHMTDHRLDGGATSELAFDATEHATLLS
jgi:hypothetical protein